jgi:hypothetical protein
VVETVSAAHLKTVYRLPPETVFKYTDPNGHPIPLDYDSLYNDIIVHVDFVRDATISGVSHIVILLTPDLKWKCIKEIEEKTVILRKRNGRSWPVSWSFP